MVREIGKERKEKNRRNGEEKKTEMEKKRNGENGEVRKKKKRKREKWSWGRRMKCKWIRKKENERKGSEASDGKKWILRFIFEWMVEIKCEMKGLNGFSKKGV